MLDIRDHGGAFGGASEKKIKGMKFLIRTTNAANDDGLTYGREYAKGHLYLTKSGSIVRKVNLETNTIVKTETLAGASNTFSFLGKTTKYLLCKDGANIHVLDFDLNRIKTVVLPTTSVLFYYSKDYDRSYVIDSGRYNIHVYDEEFNLIETKVTVTQLSSGASGFCIYQDKMFYYFNNYINVYNLNTGILLASKQVLPTNYPQYVQGVRPIGENRLFGVSYAGSDLSGKFFLIDSQTFNFVPTGEYGNTEPQYPARGFRGQLYFGNYPISKDQHVYTAGEMYIPQFKSGVDDSISLMVKPAQTAWYNILNDENHIVVTSSGAPVQFTKLEVIY